MPLEDENPSIGSTCAHQQSLYCKGTVNYVKDKSTLHPCKFVFGKFRLRPKSLFEYSIMKYKQKYFCRIVFVVINDYTSNASNGMNNV